MYSTITDESIRALVDSFRCLCRIVISKGRLLYTIGKEQCYILTSETAGVIEPEKFHFVTPLDNAEFVVEFYKDPLPLSSGLSSP